MNKRQQGRVRFGCAKVREYGVTVGSHAYATDSCPIQLTWEHTEEHETSLNDDDNDNSSSTNDDIDVAVKQQQRLLYRRHKHKLTIDERRHRISSVQGICIDQVIDLEVDTVLRQIYVTEKCFMETTKKLRNLSSSRFSSVVVTTTTTTSTEKTTTQMTKYPCAA